MKQKQGYYMVIPAGVWDTDLSDKAILAYGHITLLSKKDGYCYANNKYFEKVLKASTSTVTRILSELEARQLISRKIIYKQDSKEIQERRIYMTTGIIMDDHSPIVTDEPRPIITGEPDNNTRNNNTSINNIDDMKGKIFFRIVEAYPKNRIGNRQRGLKKFQKLDMDQCKLAAKNLKRYLKVTGEFYKNLENYITENCYTEEWLKAEEKNKKKKGGNNYTDTAHNFNGNY